MFLCCFALLLNLLPLVSSQADPVVTLKNGVEIHGLSWQPFPHQPPIYSFQGIHFATVPARFSPSVPYVFTSPVYQAKKYGPSCWQSNASDPLPREYSEDCLYLDIYRPPNHKKHLPVGVWIYGGSFSSGMSAFYDATALVHKEDIVIVAINYRLGPYGFLNTPDTQANLGFIDQQDALKWVQHNIESFGGDPHLVTIFGESAGAISVASHLVAPGSKDLFHRVIIESGFFAAYPTQEAQNNGAVFTEKVGCGNAPDKKKCLSDLTPEEILKEFYSVSWGLSIDGTQITEQPYDLMAQGKFARVPVLFGNNEDETSLFVCPSFPNGMNGDTYMYLLNEEFKKSNPGNTTAVVGAILQRFPRQNDSLDVYIDVGTLWVWICPMKNAMHRISEFGVRTYQYTFEIIPGWASKCERCAHAFELPFIYPIMVNYFKMGYQFTAKELRLSDFMLDAWSRWIAHGRFGEAEWPEYRAPRWLYKKLGDEIVTSSQGYKIHECQFFYNITGKEYYVDM